MENNLIGNVSTIAVWIYCILAPYIGQYISQDVFLAIFGLLLALWSSSNPNTFKWLGNGLKTCTCNCQTEETLVNEEYEQPIIDEEGGC